jgi:hypothetical protein
MRRDGARHSLWFHAGEDGRLKVTIDRGIAHEEAEKERDTTETGGPGHSSGQEPLASESFSGVAQAQETAGQGSSPNSNLSLLAEIWRWLRRHPLMTFVGGILFMALWRLDAWMKENPAKSFGAKALRVAVPALVLIAFAVLMVIWAVRGRSECEQRWKADHPGLDVPSDLRCPP